MTDERDIDDLLGPFLAAAQATPPEPSAAYLSAVLAAAAPAPRSGGWREWLAGLGGWGTLGGMATAAAVGLWLGFVGGGQVIAPTDTVSDSVSLFGESDILALAGE